MGQPIFVNCLATALQSLPIYSFLVGKIHSMHSAESERAPNRSRTTCQKQRSRPDCIFQYLSTLLNTPNILIHLIISVSVH